MRRSSLVGAMLLACCGGGEETEAPAPEPVAQACAPGEATSSDGACIAAGVPKQACGDGFASDGRGGCVAVLPPAPCAAGQVALMGERTCRALAPCGDGKWGPIPSEPGTQFVDAGYPGGDSDGSETKPWTSVQAGVSAAAPGAIVAVAEGSYSEDVLLQKPVRLWGRCPERVTIVGSGMPSTAAVVVYVGASGAEIHTLAVTGGALGVFVAGAENALLDRVWIHDTGHRGLNVQNNFGPTSVRLDGVLVEKAREIGVFVSGSTAELSATVVRDTQPTMPQSGGGIQIDTELGVRGSATLRDVIVERNHYHGMLVRGADLVVERMVARDTLPAADGERGAGLVVQERGAERGSAAVVNLLSSGNHFAGVIVRASDGVFDAVTVRDTYAQASDGRFGRGMVIQEDGMGNAAVTELTRSLVERSHEVGFYLGGALGTVRSTIVREVAAIRDGTGGRGIGVESYPPGPVAHLELDASVVEQTSDAAVFVGASSATLRSVRVSGTRARADALFGDGLSVVSGGGPATVEMSDSRIEQSARAAIASFGGSVSLARSWLVCQAFDISVQSYLGLDATVVDGGDNACGCPDALNTCKAAPAALEPPESLGFD